MSPFSINPELSCRTVENDLYILDRKNAFIHSLNESGALLWESVKKGHSMDEMVQTLLSEFEIDEVTARADVDEFLKTLRERLLVEKS